MLLFGRYNAEKLADRLGRQVADEQPTQQMSVKAAPFWLPILLGILIRKFGPALLDWLFQWLSGHFEIKYPDSSGYKKDSLYRIESLRQEFFRDYDAGEPGAFPE